MGPKKSHASTGHMIHLVCPHCSKEFTGNSSTSGVRSNYKRHLLVHSGERPFSCQFCHETFTTKPNMRRHVAAAHPEQRTPTRALQEAAADTQDTAAPPPPLELPTTTTSTSSPTLTTTTTTTTIKAAASAATRTKPKEVSATTTPEPSGVSSSGDPEEARSTAETSIADTTTQSHEPEEAQEEKAPAVFTCEDCELELSSKAKLRRHQRYYCPFRDTITADPVQDALNQYRAEQQQQQQELEQHQLLRDDGDEDSDDEYGNAFDDSDADVLPSSRRRGRRDKKAALMTLTEEEKAYLTRVAAQSGLKFVEDAYVSESGSDDVYDASDASGSDSEADEENESCSQSSSSSSALLSDFNKRRMRRTPNKDKLSSPSLLHTSPKRTPLHGPLPSPDRKQLRSPRWSAGAEGGARASGGTPQGQRNTALPQTADAFFLPSSTAKPTLNGEKDESDVNPGEDLLHLHYHRRGSGHKRERLILKKRLRAQEGALLGLTTSPLRRPQKQRRSEASALELPVADSSTTSADGLTVIATAVPSGSRSAAHRPDERATTAITVSEQLASRADSLLTLHWRQSHRSKVSVSSEFVCPYCDDFTAFASQRLLTAHQQRMHPTEVARALARAATQENSQQEGTMLPFEE